MTAISTGTLILATVMILANLYSCCCCWQLWCRTRLWASALLGLLATALLVMGSFFLLVWYIQLQGGLVTMWIRNLWRSTSLIAGTRASIALVAILWDGERRKK